jgi:Arc/MetJ-type ribon-helix-helix transcriptional regulator
MPSSTVVVAVRLPREWVEAIDELVRRGVVATRSEFIYEAVRRAVENTDVIRFDKKILQGR